MQMKCRWWPETRCITRTKCKTTDKNPTTEEISYCISGKGKSWSYEYGKLYLGRYNTPPLREDLVPGSRMAPERKAEEEEVKQSCFFDKSVKPTNLERSQGLKKWHDGGEQNLKHSVQQEEQGTLREPCRLKDMKQELNGSKGIWKHTGRKEKQGTPCEPWSLQSYEWREQWTRSTCKHSSWNGMYKER